MVLAVLLPGGAWLLLALGRLLEREGVLLVHGGDDVDHEVLALLELGGDLLTKLALRQLHVVLRRAVVRQEVQVAVVNVDELVLAAGDVRHVHVVRRGRNVLVLPVGEDVRGHQVDLGVTVLAGLRGRHVDDLAGAALDHDVAVLAQGRALLGVGERGAGVGGLEVDVLSLVVGLGSASANVPCCAERKKCRGSAKKIGPSLAAPRAAPCCGNHSAGPVLDAMVPPKRDPSHLRVP